MSNFAFLAAEFPTVYEAAAEAELQAGISPTAAAFFAGKTVEVAVKWAFKNDPGLKLPYQDNIAALLHEPTFRKAAGEAVYSKARYINTLRNRAVHEEKKINPGDAVGAVLLNGDFTVAATGTVTYIDGNHVYAFGHPFLDMGEISFPMATSEIVTVLPSLATSFKFSNTGPVVGVLRQDRSAGIMGILGEKTDLIPIEVTLNGSGPEQVYRVNAVRH